MTTHLRLFILVVGTSLVSGCMFIPMKGNKFGSSSQSLTSEKCKPSQHWDGEKCRHNGNGKGARKHDG